MLHMQSILTYSLNKSTVILLYIKIKVIQNVLFISQLKILKNGIICILYILIKKKIYQIFYLVD